MIALVEQARLPHVRRIPIKLLRQSRRADYAVLNIILPFHRARVSCGRRADRKPPTRNGVQHRERQFLPCGIGVLHERRPEVFLEIHEHRVLRSRFPEHRVERGQLVEVQFVVRHLPHDAGSVRGSLPDMQHLPKRVYLQLPEPPRSPLEAQPVIPAAQGGMVVYLPKRLAALAIIVQHTSLLHRRTAKFLNFRPFVFENLILPPQLARGFQILRLAHGLFQRAHFILKLVCQPKPARGHPGVAKLCNTDHASRIPSRPRAQVLHRPGVQRHRPRNARRPTVASPQRFTRNPVRAHALDAARNRQIRHAPHFARSIQNGRLGQRPLRTGRHGLSRDFQFVQPLLAPHAGHHVLPIFPDDPFDGLRLHEHAAVFDRIGRHSFTSQSRAPHPGPLNRAPEDMLDAHVRANAEAAEKGIMPSGRALGEQKLAVIEQRHGGNLKRHTFLDRVDRARLPHPVRNFAHIPAIRSQCRADLRGSCQRRSRAPGNSRNRSAVFQAGQPHQIIHTGHPIRVRKHRRSHTREVAALTSRSLHTRGSPSGPDPAAHKPGAEHHGRGGADSVIRLARPMVGREPGRHEAVHRKPRREVHDTGGHRVGGRDGVVPDPIFITRPRIVFGDNAVQKNRPQFADGPGLRKIGHSAYSF